MTTSEIAFLALGLVLGAAIGAALAQVMRARPASRREVRLTITPNAIPVGRTRTLAARDGSTHPEAVPGSPESVALEDALALRTAASRADDRGPEGAQARTRVPSLPVTIPPTAVGVPVRGERPVAPAAPGVSSPGIAAGVGSRAFPAETGLGAPRAAASTEAASPPPSAGQPSPRPPAGPAPGQAPGGSPRTTATALAPAGRAGTAPLTEVRAGVAVLAASPGAGVAVLPSPRDARSVTGDGFTTLVRPRPPVEEPRPALAPRAVPVAVPPALEPRPAPPPPADPAAAVATARPSAPEAPADGAAFPARTPLPQARLAPPSGPPLTLPRTASVPTRPSPTAGGLARAVPPRPRAEGSRADAPGSADGTGSAPARPDASADPCAGPRRMIDERCALAGVARDQAKAALDALRDAQRAYDVLRDRVDRAEAIADPRRVAAEKDRLHAAFRAATERARGTEETETAARAWLDEINALNAAVREAQRIVDNGGAELRASHPALVRLSAEADAARIAAENAEAGCREARQELSDCEEAEARNRQVPAPPPEEPHPFAGAWPLDRPDLPDRGTEPAPAERLGGVPAVVRILRGDREARERLVASLAIGEPDTEREWQLRIARLVDAIAGRAIEDGYLDTPDDHPFWRLFERREARDIVGALSALGFRYDGLGGFADGRVPAARDLSLAVGYAGLDRMRIRTWPHESEIAALYEQAVVAADEWLSDQAGDLSLGRMVDALGGRAAELADIWNAWGRVRPALLAR